MIEVLFPEPNFKMKKVGEKQFIFDSIRKTWLQLTDEEWVRQNFIKYLIEHLHYPSVMISLEKTIQLNDLKKRFDILIYDKEHKPWMMVECKGHDVALTENVLQQVLRYNISVPVQYLIITNGKSTIAWTKENNGLKQLNELPRW
ncbi:MAG: type I restriction enzyme HsdR N-terminal domain-containing protein [Bacteroidota bacterium]|jgi:hypothetical protein|nr:type I restriction enzyme HsdR N-terminal domain-containing protein [Bacteroidota bacterium]